MTNSVRQDRHGPTWPLGLIVNATPGTPVGIMSLVDSSGVNDPNTITTSTAAEFTVRAQQIVFVGMKAGTTHGLQNNSGNIYIIQRGGTGSANRDDTGTIVLVVPTGATAVLASAPLNRNVFCPYEYQIDSDNVGDSCLVTLIIQ